MKTTKNSTTRTSVNSAEAQILEALPKIETIQQLKNLQAKAKKARLTIARKGDLVSLGNFEKTKGRTRAEAIAYNEGRCKVRVKWLYRYFTVVPSKLAN